MSASSLLPLELSAILIGGCLVYGLLVHLARVRGKRLSPATFLVFLCTLFLFCIDELLRAHQITQPIPHLEQALRVAGFLGVAFVLLRALDVILIEAVLVDRMDLYFPTGLRMVLVAVGLSFVGLFLLDQVVGVNVIALIAVPTVLTAIAGFSLKDTLARVASGVMLGRMMREGDWVTLNGHEGRVAEISLGQVTLHNRAGDAVMLPNDIVCGGVIENHNRPVVYHGSTMVVEIAALHAPAGVIDVLTAAGRAVQGVLQDPAPVCYAKAFKGSAIEYHLQFWFDDFNQRCQLESDVLTYVWHALRRNGIEPGSTDPPAASPDDAARLSESGDGLAGLVKHLHRVDFLSVLSDEELATLAKCAKGQVYLRGEVVVQQGEQAEDFFILFSGEAAVVTESGRNEREVARLGPGDFFGEMSVLTGETRSATIKALTKVSILVVDRAAISAVFQRNRALITRVGQVIRQRKAELAAKERATVPHHERRPSEEDDDQLIGRIRAFFGL